MLRSRGVGRLAALAIGLAIGVAAMAAMAGTAAAAGIDTGFGEGGIVQLDQTAPAGLHLNPYAEGAATLALPGGSVLRGEPVQTCANQWEAGCEQLISFVRYGPTGAPDPTYGQGGFLTIPRVGIEFRGLAVDARGRLLVVSGSEHGKGPFSITRYTAAGVLDQSFGRGGRAAVPAPGAEASFEALVVSPDGQLTVAFDSPAHGAGEYGLGHKVTLIRLFANGSPDRGFGKGGRMSFAGPGGASQVVPTRKNGLLILSSSCCGRASFTPVYRVAASGRLDTRFDARERRAQVRLLAGLKQPSVNAVVARPGGEVDLLGSSEPLGSGGGFVMRLTGQGNADTRFGKQGVSMLGHGLVSGAAGVGGSTLALYEYFQPYPSEAEAQIYVVRLLGNGSPDPSFGGEAGIALPSPGRGGEILGAAEGGASILVNRWRTCREVCAPLPYLTRVIEPAAPRTGHGKGKNR